MCPFAVPLSHRSDTKDGSSVIWVCLHHRLLCSSQAAAGYRVLHLQGSGSRVCRHLQVCSAGEGRGRLQERDRERSRMRSGLAAAPAKAWGLGGVARQGCLRMSGEPACAPS